MHIGSVHEIKKSYKGSICNFHFSQKLPRKYILNQFMRTKSHTSAQFVISVVLKKGNLKIHIVTVMTTKSHLSAQFVILVFLKKLA